MIDGNGTFEFDGLFAETLTINATASGTLVSLTPAEFSGAMSGFNGNDQLHLTDISAVNATLNYTANADGTGGVLSVSDGTHAANIRSKGNTMPPNSNSAADATGGTSIVYVAHNDHVV